MPLPAARSRNWSLPAHFRPTWRHPGDADDRACAPRRADRRLPLLAKLFLEEVNAEGGRQLAGFSPEALDELAGYPWPGNLDELADMVRRAHAAAGESTITPRDLPKHIGLAADAALAAAAAAAHRPGPRSSFEQIEAELIQKALEQAKGNKSRAAELLGLSPAVVSPPGAARPECGRGIGGIRGITLVLAGFRLLAKAKRPLPTMTRHSAGRAPQQAWHLFGGYL